MEIRNRRKPQSSGRWFSPGPLHRNILSLLQDYEYLSSTHIIAHLGGYKNYIQRNLTNLVSERNTPHKGPYLRRPHQQEHQPNYLNRPEVYELTDRAYAWLKDHGLFNAFAYQLTHLGRRRPHTEYPHEIFADELLSNLALGAREAGHEFIHASRILAKAPQRVIEVPSPLTFQFDDRRLTPDRMFGIKKGEGQYDFFALEADRDRMPGSRSGSGSSIARKVQTYAELMSTRAYEHRLSLPNLRVLFLTIDEAQSNIALDCAKSMGGFTWLYVKCVPEFADPFRSVPPLPELYATPWKRAGYADAFINQP